MTSDALEQRTEIHNDTEPAAERGTIRERVKRSLKNALITGRFIPGKAVTLRGLAEELGVSPMPVREAVRSLAAENALDMRPNGRIQVPTMSRERLDELLQARLMLEPQLAARALPALKARDVTDLRKLDDAIDDCLGTGDAESYMRLNHDFHFHIYRQAGSQVLLPLARSVWLQFAPFMRTVYGRVGTTALVDHHKEAIEAVELGDQRKLTKAIVADIKCGMDFIPPSSNIL